MSDDASAENLRKFLESDDPALRRMGLSMADYEEKRPTGPGRIISRISSNDILFDGPEGAPPDYSFLRKTTCSCGGGRL